MAPLDFISRYMKGWPEIETYAKEQRLVEDIREELRQGRRCQVYATFTGQHDVTGRLPTCSRKPVSRWRFYAPRWPPTSARPGMTSS